MGLSATVHVFEATLNDADRGVHATLDFRVARHPSETAEFLTMRVLAYCLEYGEGLEFSKGGLSDPDQPALAVRDLTGALRSWIEVGLPEPARLHKAAKAAPRVAVYAHKEVSALLPRLAAAAVHRASDIELYTLDAALLEGFARRLDRRMRFDLAVSDRQLYLTLGPETLSGALTRHAVGLPAGRPRS